MSSLKVIAIDGPAASGKSSVARKLAEKLGWIYVNTGNMYRAATLAVIQSGVDYENEAEVIRIASSVSVECRIEAGKSVVRVDGREVELELNSESVNRAVSFVARVPEVRSRLVAIQQDLGRMHPVIMEGRDIGTHVFPEAPYKFYIDASEEVRASRRGLQGQTDSVRERDRMDSTRKTAPLMIAQDATVIDSSEMTLDQVVETVLKNLQLAGLVSAS
ncbi:(d)CMP kinase [soil metagenome]